ncbi:exosortase/archaeosortase family protein [Pontiella agarivorans]|uniref:Exosortase/archaeosortase family protein n=1 Tax=Pontiella agarivorans TaxID=3038953 RepID=A0ABU5MT56_9BACT|nr:exosortase/archaeosortase family protein [Pontiella agarivorans]MDZ8117396.1 exosortase/archaeosortase family protein [Pontiella agarivorans]
MEEVKTSTALIWSDRWRLGALSKTEMLNIGFASVLIGMLFVLFHLFGNTVENVGSKSAFVWMVARWGDKISFGADYSHGYLIPFVSLGVVWYKRADFFAAQKKSSYWGLVVVIGSLFMHWLGAKMQQPRLSLMALIGLIWGIPFYFYGWEVAKLLIFPCSYLIFCVPLNFLDALSGPLQRVATTMGYNLLTDMGIQVQRVGTQLISDYFQLNVEAACSGLRSLLAMTALTAVYAYFTQKTFVKKWLLFLCCIPIAVAGNIGRIISIALVSITTGQEFGAGLHHDWSGYVLFTVAISLMVGFGKLLDVNYKELFVSWKKAYLSRS